MRKITDLAYGSDSVQVLDLLLPDAAEFPVFVYFHGGGLENGSRRNTAVVDAYLVAHGVAVAEVEYRMYPTAHYPDFVEDAAAAVAWVHAHIGEYGRCRDIFVGGSSAGGYLSMMLCFDKRWLGAHGIAPTDLAGFVHDAGQPTTHFNVLRERGVDSRRAVIDEAAPLFHIGTAEILPPMLIIVSDNDMKARFEQTQLVLATLRHFNYDMTRVFYREMHGTHCAYVCRTDENGDSELGQMVLDFMQK